MSRSWPRRILVTGGSGFLGRYLCRHLVKLGFAGRIVSFDLPGTDAAGRLPGCEFDVEWAVGDVRNYEEIAGFMMEVDLVFHLAAIASLRACELDPARAWAVNVEGTEVVLRAASGRRLLLMSSATIYAPAATATLREDAPIGGVGVYAETKRAAERLCVVAACQERVETIIVRNFNTYGGGQASDFLIPQMVQQALHEGRIEIADCRPVRDFTFIDDAVEAIAALGLRPVESSAVRIFNLGSGQGSQVGQVALDLGRLLGVPVTCAHRTTGSNPRLVAANQELREAVAWQPTVSLAAGLARTVDWFLLRISPTTECRLGGALPPSR